jgi:hypothetical protein
LRASIASPRLRRIAASLLALTCLAQARCSSAADAEITEHQVKAAFIYNFAKYVEWPEAKDDSTDGRLFVCVVGNDPVGAELKAAVHDKTAKGKRLVVEHVEVGNDLRHCHMLFVGRDGFDPAAVLDEVRDVPVLTVGDSDDFALRGGMINFRMQETKVRFEINAAAAEKARVRISSQLLKLAIRLIGTPPGEE